MMSDLLAIFPLDMVAVPGAAIPLHIFEPRYREMVGECLEEKKPFGIVRVKEEAGVAEIGCTVEIVDVTKRYEDGRLEILTQGRRRFELMEVNEERSFLRAEVMYFDDEPGESPQETEVRAIELFSQIVKLLGSDTQPPPAGTPLLSFLLIAPLPLDLDFKQTLLGMRSESERIATIVEYYEALLPRVRRTIHARQKAGGNGHAS